jgi:outer membrane receptor protein involved in Fe transport
MQSSFTNPMHFDQALRHEPGINAHPLVRRRARAPRYIRAAITRAPGFLIATVGEIENRLSCGKQRTKQISDRNTFVTVAISLLALLPAIFSPVARAQATQVKGTVRDSSGAAVAGAEIALRAASYSATTLSDSTGNFAFENVAANSGTVTISAKGFQIVQKSWNATPGGSAEIDIVLSPSAAAQQVIVTGARAATPLSESPSSDLQLSSEDLESTPALTLDDALRQVPGFSLFRRSSSRTANPTTQGVSLRGLGASGASRVLVLEDGIPLNDPFGSWVYWDRVPDPSIANVEVAQEGASSLYGSEALGGVVQFLSRPAEPAGITLEASYGNQNTPEMSVWAGGQKGKWESTFSGDVFHTDGYVLIPESERGTVDVAAGSEHGTADFMIGREIGNGSEIFARGWYLDESRANGTPDQINNTRLGEGALGANLQLGNFGALTLRFYADAQTYHQTFSSVASNRNSETLTDLQTVPAQGTGGSAVWSRGVGKRQTLVAGVDAHEELGHSDEILYVAGKNTIAGGHQRTTGVFGEDIIQISRRWRLEASARFDHWSNFDAALYSAPFNSAGALTPYANSSYNAFDPRLTVVNQVTSRVSWSASVYRAFRAPSLNELYRSFRQGNTLTESNPDLTAERLTGGEAGVAVNGFNRRLEIRGTAFFNEIIDPVANVTLSVTPSLITRQRQNLGRTDAPGVEFDGIAHITSRFQFSAGYQFVDAKVSSFPGDAALVGLWVAQVPHNVLTFQARYTNPRRISLSAEGRMVGLQYDDDQNQFPMSRFFVLDAMASREVGGGLEAFAAVENLFNQQYATAATPIEQLGLPIAARVGFRFQIPSRK